MTSAYPEQNGWYRGQVNITFTCTPGSAPLASDCPAMASLTAVGANQSLTETIEDTDGGTASITVTENIDLGAPTITKVRPRAGKCAASDPVSGMGSCVVKRTRVHGRHGTRVEWTAIATDRAGNVAKAFGAYKV
ncbi:MAG TPA: hypothetical protein VHB69_12315 [Mycobacteriales bacterium]|nr:hypothetical protein [Mycobacteriales bacterium]